VTDAPTLTAVKVGHPPMTIEPGRAQRDWMTASPQAFAKRCLPMLIANQHGWVLLNPQRTTAYWNGRDQPGDVTTTGAAIGHFGCGIVTWTLPYLFVTDPGYQLLLRGPANLPKDGASALEGLVETDWSPATATMNWKLTRPGLKVTWDEGEPIAMVVPVDSTLVERTEAVMAGPDHPVVEAYEAWSQSRNAFLVRMKHTRSDDRRPGVTWEGGYFHGEIGERINAEHRTRLRVKPF
jgi:hypothetical protein